jgi:hypothetical protein
MRQQLSTDKRVVLYGNHNHIEQAMTILTTNIPNLPTLSESQARIRIQDCIDSENIKADILFDGNSIWSKKRILKDIKTVNKYGMVKLSDYLYKFLHLSCGSIAHYNKSGWIDYYPTVNHLKQFFRKNEFGNQVLHQIPHWHSDAISIVKEIEPLLGI